MRNLDEPLPLEVQRLVLSKLPDILTLEEDDVRPLLFSAPQVCARLAIAFERMTREAESRDMDSLKSGSREWLRHTMASLPLRDVRQFEGGALSIKSSPGASLRYLLMKYMPNDKAITDKGVLNRERLCHFLYEQLSDKGRDCYSQIAAWQPGIGLSEDYDLQGDVAIAKYIHLSERIFHRRYAALEADLRARLGLSDTEPTPIDYIGPLASGAKVGALEQLTAYVTSVPADAGTPDDLLVVVLTHVGANRVLLESAYRNDLAQQAISANLLLLNAMNAAGILAIPQLDSGADVKACLMGWFGEAGLVSKTAGWKALSDEDILVALNHASEAQAMYRRTRGAHVVETTPEAFNTPDEKLRFALALVACYYGKVAVREELVGQHRPTYLVFPKRDEQLREEPLSPHALEMVMTLFGQMAMSNAGASLSAAQVDDYAHATGLRRGHCQELVFEVFKKWTPPQLRTLQAGIERAHHEIKQQRQ